MANDYKIEISAVDKVTATVKKINASMEKLISPATNFQKSLADLKKEAGLNVLVKSLKAVGTAAVGVAESVASIVAPMAAIIGIGTIAGVAALVTEWGKLGFEINKSASLIGISSDQLQALRGAASMAGVAAGELDGGLKSVGDTLQNAQFGRNQEALMMMNRLGISVHRLKDGSVDAAQGLMDISKAIQGRNVEVQRLIANAFGAGSLLPLLQKGPKAIEAFQRKYRELAGVMSGPALDAAANFQVQMTLLHASVDGLRNRISEQLIPVMSPLIEQFTNWIAQNRELISQKVGEWAQNIVSWVKKMYAAFKAGEFDSTINDLKAVANGFLAIGSGIATVIEQLGKLGKIPIPGFLRTATWLPKLIFGGNKEGGHDVSGSISGQEEGKGSAQDKSLLPKQKNYPQSTAVDVAKKLIGMGWAPAQAAGITGSLVQESGLDPTRRNPKSGAYGIGQWLGSRVTDFKKFSGKDLVGSSLDDQLAFQQYELTQGIERPAGDKLRKTMTAEQAALVHSQDYERPGAAEANNGRRQALADDILAQLGSGSINPPMDVTQLARSQINQNQAPQPKATDGGVPQQFDVHVKFENAPAGTTASAKSSAGADVPTRIAYAMPTSVTP